MVCSSSPALLVRQHLLLGEVCLQPSLIIRTAVDETASWNEIHNELACSSARLGLYYRARSRFDQVRVAAIRELKETGDEEKPGRHRRKLSMHTVGV